MDDVAQFRGALAVSGIVHLVGLVALLSTGIAGDFQPPVVYSVTIEAGKSLGGIQQAAKKETKEPPAPPKKVSGAAEAKSKPTTKSEEKAEVSVRETKPAKKIETKPKEEKKPPKPVKTPSLSDINKQLDSALQRYLGESTSAGGKGFGAGQVGGKGMGGGAVRPPEFFRYRQLLESHVKEGWRWYDTNAALMAQIEFSISPEGELSEVRLGASSGNAEFDESALRAVRKASPVPAPPPAVYQFFKSVRMTFDPRG